MPTTPKSAEADAKFSLCFYVCILCGIESTIRNQVNTQCCLVLLLSQVRTLVREWCHQIFKIQFNHNSPHGHTQRPFLRILSLLTINTSRHNVALNSWPFCCHFPSTEMTSCLVYAVMWMEPRAFCTLGKHSTVWATPLALLYFYLIKCPAHSRCFVYWLLSNLSRT